MMSKTLTMDGYVIPFDYYLFSPTVFYSILNNGTYLNIYDISSLNDTSNVTPNAYIPITEITPTLAANEEVIDYNPRTIMMNNQTFYSILGLTNQGNVAFTAINITDPDNLTVITPTLLPVFAD